MKQRKNLQKNASFFGMLFVLFMLSCFLPEYVFAASKTGSITIQLKNLETPMGEVAFKVYPVGDWNGTQESWELYSNLSDTGICLSDLSKASEWQEASQKLSVQSALETMNYKSGTTDENGELKISDLAWGMYLVVQTEEGQYGTIDPFLVPIPYVTEGVQESDRIVSPKAVKQLPKEKASLEQAEIKLSETDYIYDGMEKKPTVTVKYGTEALKENIDYTVAYSNHIKAGTASVTITGMGNYTGTQVQTFHIAEASVQNAQITLACDSYFYTGEENRPDVTVTLNGTSLKKDTDYTVAYSDNIKIGTASVTITGTGNYTKTAVQTFTIKAKKGTTFADQKNKYKVTGASTVAFNGIVKAKTTKVTIPATVKYGGTTFEVTSVAQKALKNKTKVKNVIIGKNVKSIGSSAFYGCKNLKRITIKSTSLKKAGKNAFKGDSF